MAHFAYVTDGVVKRVHVVANAALDPSDEEGSGQVFLAGLHGGVPSDYVQTSYNASMRGKYAGVGDLWDGENFTSPVVEAAE